MARDNDDWVFAPIRTQAELADYGERRDNWILRRVNTTGTAERLTPEEAALFAQMEMRYLQASHVLGDQVTADARAAIAAANPASGVAGGITPRQQRAAAFLQAGAGRTQPDADGVSRGDNGELLFRLAASERAVTGVANVMHPITTTDYPLVRNGSVLDVLGIYPMILEEGRNEVGWLTTAPPAVHAAEDPSLTALTPGQTGWGKHVMTPGRFYDHRGFTVEAGATWPDAADRIARDMVANIADLMEKEILVGDGSPVDNTELEWSGIDNRAHVARAAPAAGDPADGYDDVVKAVAGQVDGKFAMRRSDLRVIASPTMHEHLSGLLAPSTSMSAWDWIEANVGATAVSAHWPAVAANNGKLLIRRGMREGAYVLTVWENMRSLMENISRVGVGTTATSWILADFFVPDDSEQREDWQVVNIKTGT